MKQFKTNENDGGHKKGQSRKNQNTPFNNCLISINESEEQIITRYIFERCPTCTRCSTVATQFS